MLLHDTYLALCVNQREHISIIIWTAHKWKQCLYHLRQMYDKFISFWSLKVSVTVGQNDLKIHVSMIQSNWSRNTY